MHRLFFAILVGMLLLSCASHQSAQTIVPPAGHETFFVLDNPPTPSGVAGNPLDYSASRIGLDLSTFSLPQELSGNYRFAARFPAIDYVMNNSPYMKKFTEETAKAVKSSHASGGLDAVSEALAVLRGTRGFRSPDKAVCVAADHATELKQLRDSMTKFGFTGKYQDEVAKLVMAYLDANDMASVALEKMPAEDKEFFFKDPSYYLYPGRTRMPDITGDLTTIYIFMEKARRVPFDEFFKAGLVAIEGVNEYVRKTRNFKDADFYTPECARKGALDVSVNKLRLSIAAGRESVCASDAALSIDLGGDDTYARPVASTATEKDRISIFIDHAGNDSYKDPEGFYGFGFGFLGAGILVDMAGNDSYESRHFTQGAGVMGIGVLWDIEGDDKYSAHSFCQGAGVFGLGMLLDDKGSDWYDCATLGQAAASTLGYGVLSDLTGNDIYRLYVDKTKDPLSLTGSMGPGYGQGGAVSFRPGSWIKGLTPYGGIGMLIEGSGDDDYQSTAWCTQGGSYIMSLGALVDFEGNDKHAGSCSIGSSIHVTAAIMIDFKGNDIYGEGFRNGGSGSDRSPGILVDYEGDDIYGFGDAGCEMAFGVGCKPLGLSIMVDYRGKDTYQRKITGPGPREGYPRDVFGGVWAASTPTQWPYGICLDLGGNDDYQVANRANNTERIGFGHGIHLDTEWSGGDVFGDPKKPLPEYAGFALPETVRGSVIFKDIEALQRDSNFDRFNAVGRIVARGKESVPALVDAMLASDNRQFDRDAMECIYYIRDNGGIGDAEAVHLARLMDSKSEEIRCQAVYYLGVWGFNAYALALMQAAESDPAGEVRRYALSGLSTLKRTEFLPRIKTLAVKDPYMHVRRIAVAVVGGLEKEASAEFLMDVFMKDPLWEVKHAAVLALSQFRDDKSLELLRTAAKGEDVFIKRAAAKALVLRYDMLGLESLIETLAYPSIDDYGGSEAEFIAAYAGHDLPGGERQLAASWKKWLAENRDKIDLKRNVDSYKEFAELEADTKDKPVEERIARMEEFLAKYPDNIKARKALGGILNSVSWEMVTAPPESAGRDVKKGLAYAIRAVELLPEAMVLDTLAEAYYVNGDLDNAIKISKEWLDRSPDLFQPRLDQYLKEKDAKEPKR